MLDFDLIELLGKMGSTKIKSAGQNIQASCPFAPYSHAKGKDANPSFSILSGSDNKWNCFSCGKKGRTVQTLIRAFENASGKDLGFDDPNPLKRRLAQSGSRYHPKQVLSNGWFEYLNFVSFNIEDFSNYLSHYPRYAADRGITKEQAKKWKIGYNTEEKRLFIPIFDRYGIMVGYSGRATMDWQTPKYRHAKGFSRNDYLYGMNFVDKSNNVACVSEGFMDVLNLDRNGITNCFAIMGTAFSEAQLNFLCEFSFIWIFPHNDTPDANGEGVGMKSAILLKDALLSRGKHAIIADIIPGKKDVGDWTAKEIQDTVLKLKKNQAPTDYTNDKYISF